MASIRSLDGPATDEFVNQNISLLANSESTVGRLIFHGGVPPAIKGTDVIRRRESEPAAAGLQGTHAERRPLFVLECTHQRRPLADRGVAVQNLAGTVENAGQEIGQRLRHRLELREHQDFFLTLGDRLT